MKVGARNRVIGEVESISKGQVMCLVKLAIPEASNMASVMTLESLEEMQLKKGDTILSHISSPTSQYFSDGRSRRGTGPGVAKASKPVTAMALRSEPLG
jgi:molybdate transport system regulatory protein